MCGAKLVVILLLSGLSLSLAALSLSQEVEVVRCAKAGLVFLPGNRSCYQPLTTGPCGPGLMVVLDTESLLGRCVERKCENLDMVWDEERGQCGDIYEREDCAGPGQRYFFTPTGGTRCGCEGGWRETEAGGCQQAGLVADCGEGELLQQTDLPSTCDCRAWRDCPAFTRDLALLSQTRREGSVLQYRLGVERLASLVCEKQQQRVCCPPSQTLTLSLGPSDLLATISRHYQRQVACAPNNCPPGHIPWPDRPGRCFRTETGRARSGSCRLALAEDSELVVCQEDVLVRNVPGAYSSKCGRGRIWSRYRSTCVGLFF